MKDDASTARATKVRDLICSMEVDPATAPHRVEHEGTSYFFCGACCAEEFDKAPGAAIGIARTREGGAGRGAGTAQRSTGQSATEANAKYICAMCPGMEKE